MAVEHRDMRVDGRPGPRMEEPIRGEPPLGELFKQLSEDGARLIRQEMALAKAELRETGSALGQDAKKLGIAIGLALLGAMAATAFLILGIGDLIDNYWLAALMIVTVAYLGIAAAMGKGAMNDVKTRNLKPSQTIDTLRADAEWARQEAQVVKQEWKS
jgi:uncharacterized membrane protein YqjE